MALISHITVYRLAFENGNYKFLKSEIIDFSDKKKGLISFGFFSQVDGIFDISSIYNTTHDFLRAYQNCL